MQLLSLLFASAGAFALLHFVAVPAARLHLRKGGTSAALQRAGVLAVLGFCRTACLVATLSFGLVLVVLGLARLGGGGTPEELGVALARLQSWRAGLEPISAGWSLFVVLVLVVILVALVRRAARQRVESALQAAQQRVLHRLRGQKLRGELEALPPTQAMAELEELRSALVTARDSLDEQEMPEEVKQGMAEEIRQRLVVVDSEIERLDLERRVDLSTEELKLDSGHGTARTGWRSLLMSEGFVVNLGRSSRILYVGGLALLFLSLVGVASAPLSRSLSHRAVELDQMRVELSQEEARASFMGAVGGAEEDREPEPDDDELVDYLAQQFETAFLESAEWGREGLPPGGGPLRPVLARQAILDASAAVGRGRVGRVSLGQAGGLGPMERRALDLVGRSEGGPGPRTTLGQRVRQDLSELPRRSSVWNAIRSKLEAERAAFRRPARLGNVGGVLAGEVFGQAVEGLGGGFQGEFAGQARQMVTEVGQAGIDRMYQAKLERYVTELAGEGSLRSATEAVRNGSAQRPVLTLSETEALRRAAPGVPADRVLAERLAGQPPSLGGPPEKGSPERVGPAMERLRRTGAAAEAPASTRLADALATYDDWFPGREGAERTTRRGRTLQEWQSRRSAPGAPAGPATAGTGRTAYPGSSGSFRRARSFARLRGFTRVGGVLIGREPEGERLDFTGFDWRLVDGQVHLAVTRRDGETFRLGPFRPSLVHHALVYAADGRPTAVTMTTAHPLAELKILVHPAFVDTPLGCRLIELDRFVDEATGNSIDRTLAAQEVAAHMALYRWTWAHRLAVVLEAASENPSLLASLLGGVGEEDAQAAFTEALSSLDDLAVQAAAASALQDPAALEDPDRSPLAAKGAPLDAALVDLVQRCARSGSLRGHAACVERQVESALAGPQVDVAGWIDGSAPEHQDWSGVRERAYRLDPQLSFLRPPPGDTVEARLWPLDFLVQVAFAGQDGEGEEAGAELGLPWEYPRLADLIRREVDRHLREDPAKAAILEDARELTVLQRLFRLALEGHLGVDFPVEALPRLAADTAPAAATTFRTPRWNVRPGALESSLYQTLAAASEALEEEGGGTDEWLDAAVRRMNRCSNWIDSAPERAVRSAAEVWAAACGFDDLTSEATRRCEAARRSLPGGDPRPCVIAVTADLAAQVGSARDLRAALGVAEDESYYERFEGCPSLR